jgi:hypothetical protein
MRECEKGNRGLSVQILPETACRRHPPEGISFPGSLGLGIWSAIGLLL